MAALKWEGEPASARPALREVPPRGAWSHETRGERLRMAGGLLLTAACCALFAWLAPRFAPDFPSIDPEPGPGPLAWWAALGLGIAGVVVMGRGRGRAR